MSCAARLLSNPRPDFLATTPATVAARLAGADAAAQPVLQHALRYAVVHADVELVSWLAGLGGAEVR